MIYYLQHYIYTKYRKNLQTLSRIFVLSILMCINSYKRLFIVGKKKKIFYILFQWSYCGNVLVVLYCIDVNNIDNAQQFN